ncbi:unnamed protein product [Dovyalis caffra]|uniref:Uncharacterized protein n=1 Tax=Dovyalis caffra TaxID=77055 RepID=A0AAV1RMW4_9ROSI|nr:unnamed protein product [Dovyalis caffra]
MGFGAIMLRECMGRGAWHMGEGLCVKVVRHVRLKDSVALVEDGYGEEDECLYGGYGCFCQKKKGRKGVAKMEIVW